MITFSKQYLFSFLSIDILHGILAPAISVFYICLLTAGGFTDERMCRYIEKPRGGIIPNGTLLPVRFHEKKSRASYRFSAILLSYSSYSIFLVKQLSSCFAVQRYNCNSDWARFCIIMLQKKCIFQFNCLCIIGLI